jgi:SAM-dependent methyltransferase
MALPFSDERFDHALSVWVLHVVGDVGAVMREVRRVLRPGATYVVMDGHKADDEPDDVQRAWDEIDAGLGRPSFAGRIQDFASAAASNGLRAEDVITTGPYPYSTTIADTIMRIETKANSWMWTVAEDEWNRVVVPVLERLRAIPDQEAKLPRNDYQDVLVLRN